MRMALELTGCAHARPLVLVTPIRAAVIRTAWAAGFELDLFCVLEHCGSSPIGPVEDAIRGFVAAFLKASAGHSPHVQGCDALHRNISVIDEASRRRDRGEQSQVPKAGFLRPEFRAEHPYYPPNDLHRGSYTVDNTLNAWNKLRLVGEMRRGYGRYDVVWRARPDYTTRRYDWPLVMRARLRLREQQQGELAAAASRRPEPSYVVPAGAADGYHTDNEALLLSEAAADHYDSIWSGVASLYGAPCRVVPGCRDKGRFAKKCGKEPAGVNMTRVVFWPEQLITEHMNAGGFRAQELNNVYLVACKPTGASYNASASNAAGCVKYWTHPCQW